MVRHNNQLPHNLPQLQNLIKRDPASYREEFLQQYRHFENTVAVFEYSPQLPNRALEELAMFVAQVAPCYPAELRDFPQRLVDVLERHGALLDGQVRAQICRALVLLRNRSMLAAVDVCGAFFRLLGCRDRALRSFVAAHVVADAKRADAKASGALQSFVFAKLADADATAAKVSVDVMVELYRANVWNDAKTVNVLATGCFSKITKVMVACLKFFLGKDAEEKSDDSDSEGEVDPREVMQANKFNKKTRKRGKQLEKVKKLAVKQKKRRRRAPAFNSSALLLVHDPQGMAERLSRQLGSANQRFEVKLMTLDVVSRLIGLHGLLLFNYYPYLQRFMQPHQRDVTRILQFAAQASHGLVPPDALTPLLRTIASNFVTERNSSDAMAIGLNAVREICARCVLAMDEDLLQDLVRYRSYRERSVMMAATSLLQLYKSNRPEMLRRKDRGRPTEATDELLPKSYGCLDTKDHVPGAEVLLEEDAGSESESESKEDRVKRKREMAQKVSLGRILTDEDFKRIEEANVRKQVEPARKGLKRKLEEAEPETSGLVRLGDIENIYKKRRHDKQARVESVRAGQEGREKYGYKDGRLNEHCSKTNREKRKNKNFMMVRHKSKGKVKRSFKDKQIALRNHLLKIKKMK